MSHDRRDRRGGHVNNELEAGDGIVGWTPRFRKFVKWKTTRMLRRQSREIERASVIDYYADIEETIAEYNAMMLEEEFWCNEENWSGDFYDDYAEDEPEDDSRGHYDDDWDYGYDWIDGRNSYY